MDTKSRSAKTKAKSESSALPPPTVLSRSTLVILLRTLFAFWIALKSFMISSSLETEALFCSFHHIQAEHSLNLHSWQTDNQKGISTVVAYLKAIFVLVPTILLLHFRFISWIHWKMRRTSIILKTQFKVTQMVHFTYLMLVEDRPAPFPLYCSLLRCSKMLD